MTDDPHRFRLDPTALGERLGDGPLAAWHEALVRAVEGRAEALRHGHLPRWRAALASLPDIDVRALALDAPLVAVDGRYRAPGDDVRLRRALAALVPWRKGPFRLLDVTIDTEWRSDMKWARLVPHIAPLAGRHVLDVGCGSGYHLWRMRGAGAASALGIEPGLLSVMQFAAVRRYVPRSPVAVLPLTLETLPAAMALFDTVFSMGVLYHRRDPAAHLGALRAALRPGGELVLETLVSPSTADDEIVLDGRYARMRNVHALPSVPRVTRWLNDAGFADAHPLSLDVTATDEQRRTEWMPYESLAAALDPADLSLTVEGHPRPRRALFLAARPRALA